MSTTYKKSRRNTLRLRGYDYSAPNAYFITLVTWQREMIFGEIKDDEMVLSELGKIVKAEWMRTPYIRKEIELGTYIVMQNHFHAIVIINDVDTVGATGRSPLQHRSGPKPKSLGALVAVSNHLSPNVLINCIIRPVFLSGSEIIMITLFAMKKKWLASGIILKQILYNGLKIKKTQFIGENKKKHELHSHQRL